jgi:hypothetical protein
MCQRRLRKAWIRAVVARHTASTSNDRFPPLQPVNPDHAPADNRNGGTSTMIMKDWINGRLGIPDSVDKHAELKLGLNNWKA